MISPKKSKKPIPWPEMDCAPLEMLYVYATLIIVEYSLRNAIKIVNILWMLREGI